MLCEPFTKFTKLFTKLQGETKRTAGQIRRIYTTSAKNVWSTKLQTTFQEALDTRSSRSTRSEIISAL